MKIALLFPASPFLINEKVNPPLGLAYLSSYMQRFDHEVEIHHLVTGQEIPRVRADVVGVGWTTPQTIEAFKIVETLRPLNPESLFVAGGVHPTSRPQEALDHGFDTVVVGEGEQAFKRVVDTGQLGIVPADEVRDIDTLPYPDYEGLKHWEYDFKFQGKNFFSMFTSRGCPFKCAFCASPVMWDRVRLHSVDYIKEHIVYLRDWLHVEAIMFQDDVFTMKRSRVEEIGGFLKSLGMPYRALARANDLKPDMVRTLVETGCIEVGVGIESNSQQILDIMRKRTRAEQNREAILNCRAGGLSIKAFILLGAPGESHNTVRETMDLLDQTQPNDVDVNVMVMYPGTEFHDHAEDYDILQVVTDPSKQFLKGKIGQYTPTVSTSKITSQELEQYRWQIFNKHSKLMRKP